MAVLLCVNGSVTEMHECFKCVNKTMFYTALNALDVHLIAFNANDTPLHETSFSIVYANKVRNK